MTPEEIATLTKERDRAVDALRRLLEHATGYEQDLRAQGAWRGNRTEPDELIVEAVKYRCRVGLGLEEERP